MLKSLKKQKASKITKFILLLNKFEIFRLPIESHFLRVVYSLQKYFSASLSHCGIFHFLLKYVAGRNSGVKVRYLSEV